MQRAVCTRAPVRKPKESQLTIRGDWDQDPAALMRCRRLDKARGIVPTAFLVKVQRSRNDLYKAVKGPSTSHIVLSMITYQLCNVNYLWSISFAHGSQVYFSTLFTCLPHNLINANVLSDLVLLELQ